jgi:hypothetical protein
MHGSQNTQANKWLRPSSSAEENAKPLNPRPAAMSKPKQRNIFQTFKKDHT